MNANLSLSILQLVNAYAVAHAEKPKDTVERALLYRYFIEGEPLTEEATAPVAVSNPIEPGTKRKRRTKAEMEAARTNTDIPVIQSDISRLPINLDDIQKAMLRLFDKEFGIDAVQEILTTYGVKQVKDLRPEDYRECYHDLQDALSDVA